MKNKKTKQENELEKLRHKNRMEEIEFERKCKTEVEKLKHFNDLEFHRIKNADIKRSILAREGLR